MECHITINFDIAGLPAQHYRAEKSAAEAFAAEMQRDRPLHPVDIDDVVTTEMSPLPCQRLYLE